MPHNRQLEVTTRSITWLGENGTQEWKMAIQRKQIADQGSAELNVEERKIRQYFCKILETPRLDRGSGCCIPDVSLNFSTETRSTGDEQML